MHALSGASSCLRGASCRSQPRPCSRAAERKAVAPVPLLPRRMHRVHTGRIHYYKDVGHQRIDEFHELIAQDSALYRQRGHMDYDFSNLAWVQEVEDDLGWEEFWRQLDAIIASDPPIDTALQAARDAAAKEKVPSEEWPQDDRFIEPKASLTKKEVKVAKVAARKKEFDARKDAEAALVSLDDEDGDGDAALASFDDVGDQEDEGGEEEGSVGPDAMGRRLRMTRADKARAVMEVQTQLRYQPTPNFVNVAIETKPANKAPPVQVLRRNRDGELDEWTLRAKREKAEMKVEMDVLWGETQRGLCDLDVINLTELNDARAIAEWRGEQQVWSHEEIWNLVINDGQSVDPWVVRDSATYLEQNPIEVWDWAGQQIDVVEDWEHWLEDAGHLWQDKEEGVSLDVGSGLDDDGEMPEPKAKGELSGDAADKALATLLASAASEE